MKKLKSLILILALIFANILNTTSRVYAGANDFYFKSFTADYYLKKQSDNTSEMLVEETLVAEFPNYNQNHGIERTIPFLNQNDTNLTMESTDRLNIEVKRNGVSEPFTVRANDTSFTVRIGDADTYVKGEQTYTLKYKFVHVITEFDVSRYSTSAYQELYWDTNGTGWSQKFDEINVNLHMDSIIYNSLKTDATISKSATYTNKSLIHPNNTTKDQLAAWCYIGTYGSGNQDRCQISDLKDGINFKANNLRAGENLTFVANFDNKTFVVPKNNYVKTLYFKNANLDYTLSKNDDGTSNLKIKETLSANFPTANQTSYFTRHIPFVNQNRTNFITESQKDFNIKVAMDGKEITPTITPTESGYFDITIDDPDNRYIHGEHILTYEYEFKNIIKKDEKIDENAQLLSFTALENLYYDVNNLTATFHLTGDLLDSATEALCLDEDTSTAISYCTAIKTSDGFKIYVNNITYKNMPEPTIKFKDGTFVIPDVNHNYLYYHVFIVVLAAAVVAFYFSYKHFIKKVGEKIKYYQNLPIVPQYTPHRDFTAAELARDYIGRTKNEKVATMLELVINKNIELRKEKKGTLGNKYKWFVKVISLDNLTDERRDLLKILNNGHAVDKIGDEFEMKQHSYSSRLEEAFKDYNSHIDQSLKDKECFEDKKKNKIKFLSGKKDKFNYSDLIKTSIKVVIVINVFLFISPIALVFIGTFIGTIYQKLTGFTPFSVYEGEWLYPIIILILLITALAIPLAYGKTEAYRIRTMKGLEMSRYMDGLKLYIKMAEKDRLAFLQSVEGADTSDKGIVKLYEKLLPYAALLGLEKSWMNELEKYYELENIETPDWYAAGFTYSVMNSVMRSAVSHPIDTSSSSSGGGFSFSSGSSGGGGGGFSGGGGGGGGGGGW